MILFPFFLIHQAASSNREVPVVSFFCYYTESSYYEPCKKLVEHFNKRDEWINNYTEIIENLTSFNDTDTSDRIKEYQRMSDFLKYMDYPRLSDSPVRIAEVSKKTEILLIYQVGSMPENRFYDFTNLNSKMIVDITIGNTYSDLSLELTAAVAAKVNLSHDIISITRFRDFYNFILSQNAIKTRLNLLLDNLDSSINPILSLKNEVDVAYFKYVKSKKELYQKMSSKEIKEKTLQKAKTLNTNLPKSKEINLNNNSHINNSKLNKHNNMNKKIKDGIHATNNVRINGEDGNKVVYLLLSDCIFQVVKNNLKIKNVAFFQNVQIASETRSIQNINLLVSSEFYLVNSHNMTGTFNKIGFYSTNPLLSPCRLTYQLTGIYLEVSDKQETCGTGPSMLIPYTSVINQIAFISPINTIVEICVGNLEDDSENGSESDLESFKSMFLNNDTNISSNETILNFTLFHEMNFSIQSNIYYYPLEIPDIDYGSTSSRYKELLLDDHEKTFNLKSFQDVKTQDEDNETVIGFSFSGSWNLIKTIPKLIIEYEDSQKIQFFNKPEKMEIEFSLPYVYTIIDKIKVHGGIIAGIVIGCIVFLAIIIVFFVFQVVIRKSPEDALLL
ncbi:hypothetical protein TRFO_12976 [Tritrichomonas foetus]|uniref:Uncharacterized protein n=1 Tax=Tritrichomonas foetus TaxID=1144522 RepID=A0A1J4L465_9EUKA|nr:hypothetical protein TRFO_12976 [Tritrichomonas foetus]|eukprot:OHT16717.1 hypothetical protein TRFO_12976 [Tritrichomonas foetus]